MKILRWYIATFTDEDSDELCVHADLLEFLQSAIAVAWHSYKSHVISKRSYTKEEWHVVLSLPCSQYHFLSCAIKRKLVFGILWQLWVCLVCEELPVLLYLEAWNPKKPDAESEGSDQTAWMPRLIWAFDGCSYYNRVFLFVLFCDAAYSVRL